MTTPKKERERLRELEGSAYQGPIYRLGTGRYLRKDNGLVVGSSLPGQTIAVFTEREDAALFEAARRALVPLLDDLDAAEGEIARLREEVHALRTTGIYVSPEQQEKNRAENAKHNHANLPGRCDWRCPMFAAAEPKP